MINILCVCGNGMGTSTILKINVKNIAKELGVDVNVNSCSFGEANAYLSQTDMIITSPEWADSIPNSKAVKVQVKNLVDKKEVKEAMTAAIDQNFPQAKK